MTPRYQEHPVATLSRVLQILLAVVGVVGAINDVWLSTQLRSGTYVLHVPAQVNGQVTAQPYLTGSRLASLGIVVWPVMLATIVVWLVWQHHATETLWARGFHDLHIRPGWAVGWWFIPFASLVMPCVAMVELDRRSTPEGTPRPASPLVGAWWGVYLGGSIVVWAGLFLALLPGLADLGRAVNANSTEFDLTPLAHTASGWVLALGVVQAVAAALAIAVVRRISDGQVALQGAPLQQWVPIPMRPDLGV